MPITADMMDGLFPSSEKSAGSDNDSDETDDDGKKRRRKRGVHTPHDAAAPTPKEAREGYEMPEVA